MIIQVLNRGAATRILRRNCLLITKQYHEYTSNNSITSFAAIYKEHGDPNKVLVGREEIIKDKLESSEVLVSMLASPVNPADINMIQGVYPVKPELPAVGGNEGVCKVLEVGEGVVGFQQGDWAVPSFSGWGTWQTHKICSFKDLHKIKNNIPLIGAATLSVNPCTAYRMLKDFECLNKGDVVLQNGANSCVGKAVIQISRILGFQTVNIVRNRPNIDELRHNLVELGATHVITDEFVRKPEMKQFMKELPKPKLAFNCVGGKPTADLLKYIDKEGTLVTYGGMSKHPLMVPAGPLIFKNVKLRGYWMTKWNKDNMGSAEKSEMWDFLCDLLLKGELKPPTHRLVPLENFKDAVSVAMEPYINQKQILVMPGYDK